MGSLLVAAVEEVQLDAVQTRLVVEAAVGRRLVGEVVVLRVL